MFNRASLFVSLFEIINVLVINGPSCELFDGNSVRENQHYNVRHFLDGNRINRQRCEYFTLLNIKLARLTSVSYIISLLIWTNLQFHNLFYTDFALSPPLGCFNRNWDNLSIATIRGALAGTRSNLLVSANLSCPCFLEQKIQNLVAAMRCYYLLYVNLEMHSKWILSVYDHDPTWRREVCELSFSINNIFTLSLPKVTNVKIYQNVLISSNKMLKNR